MTYSVRLFNRCDVGFVNSGLWRASKPRTTFTSQAQGFLRPRYILAPGLTLRNTATIKMKTETNAGNSQASMAPPGLRKSVSSTLGKGEKEDVYSKTARLTLLYDGECPLCMKEVNMLRARSDERGGTLGFVDIAADDYDEKANGVDYETAMGRIHGVLPDGRIIDGVQVFREAYEAVGLGWVYYVTKIPGVLWFADKVYDIWADRRLQWTGRGSLEAVLNARKEKRTCR